jgi:hypothetical protein
MALTENPPSRWWSRLHFLVLFALLTGLLVAGVGFVLALLDGLLTSQALAESWANLRAGLPWKLWVLLGGLAAVLLALLFEAVVFARLVAGRRSAFGLNAAAQIALAAVLLAGVNLFSFTHYLRLDWTRGREFTLPEGVQRQLRQLRGETKIVVYQRHKTFGTLSDKPDARDYAAERKVVEKVNDLVDQFREFGPQFRVVVLDVEEEGFDRKLEQETKDAPELRAAIDGATENSIFFYAGDPGRVQRLSFNRFYQLDKTASQEQGNLVLLFQGVEPFARKVLDVDEKRPKVAIGVIHELLSTEGAGDYGVPGVKRALAAHGFDTEDLILKKSRGFSLLGPGAYTYDESRYDRLENELKILDAAVKELTDLVDRNEKVRQEWAKAPLKELTEKYAARLRVKQVTEEIRRFRLAGMEDVIRDQKEDLQAYSKKREERDKERKGLNVEGAQELQRMTDLRAKMDRLLADCDLLIIPRMTLRNLNLGDAIPNRVYQLDDAQRDAIKDFLKKGKPVFVCFGPANEPAGLRPDPANPEGPDNVEKLLAELGIHLGKTAVLFDVEAPSLAGQRPGQEQVLGANVEVPPVDFAWKGGDAWPPGQAGAERKPNPIRESMLLAERSAGRELDLRLRHPRPVYFEPPGDAQPAYAPEVMLTNPAGWNEEQPFPTEERVPHFEGAGTASTVPQARDDRRHGRFCVGVAVETPVPADWYDEKGSKPATVRVAAIGHGGLFTGPEISPARERLLLDTCNWLLGRDDRLPRDDRPWAYPRVRLDARQQELWHWGTQVGLPALFLYLGLVVLLVRRMR